MELATFEDTEHPMALLGVCLGLDGEADAVRQMIGELAPDIVALALEPGLIDHLHEMPPDDLLAGEDAVYAKGLQRWGDVTLPGPELEAAVEAGREASADVVGIDLEEDHYLDVYTNHVSMGDMVRRALRTQLMKWRTPAASSPEAFCRAFDRRVNRGSLREVERAREQAMADRLAQLAGQGSVVAVVEVQRLDGIKRELQARFPAARP